MSKEPEFTLGIEEEYLLVDTDTMELAAAPDALMASLSDDLGDTVSPEFLRCQVEIGTPVCPDIRSARDHLQRLRAAVADRAAEHGLAPISAGCHPMADWRSQDHTDKDRYNQLARDLGGVAHRMLICGMHVHVGIPDPAQRIDLMNQLTYFLPHLLALSASSPFWLGEDTRLASYRTTVFGDMPRTGLPPQMKGWDEFERSVAALTDVGVIEDSSKIWWDLRPSSKYPTLETRICDACPRIDDAVTLAALIQATLRMLWRLSRRNIRWRQYEPFLISENRWRALRYGTTEGLIDFGAGSIIPFDRIAEDWLALIAEDADALDSQPFVARLRKMVAQGSASERQRRVYSDAMADGADPQAALQSVTRHLVAEFREAPE
ncbi:carboxylate-amine ligase [Paracoccus sp. 1_MG-2023]|uniref:carboxylate-amine ligase n=1 Tax=unclassified Paracoccus (in: a-proteobacteria) TaxID=2688777 RepID=UPI001C09AEC3|nr:MULTISPECIES: carboxylate-amine ligase [unclassified Paracoccus (in: a-proteobacteria)]MBU2959038.1 carboxylate-amine ligase [Paracoccus sp. C2R09]MDO6669011.1 carboxylate-amine ligase [Paracoccus sp. 1_MG-2023]